MRRTVSLKKGLNLNLEGGMSSERPDVTALPTRVAVIPDDFPGFLPKLDVSEGDAVKAGSLLLHHKTDTRIRLVAPAAGVVESVVRGARRKIERVVVRIQGDETENVTPFADADAATITERLMASGLWAMMRRRPYDIIPMPDDAPRSIMITAMDTAPLAPSPEALVAGRIEELAAAVRVLGKLTGGHIYLSLIHI